MVAGQYGYLNLPEGIAFRTSLYALKLAVSIKPLQHYCSSATKIDEAQDFHMQTILAVKVKLRTATENPSRGFHKSKVRQLVFLGLCNDKNGFVVGERKEVFDALVDAVRSFVDIWGNVPHFENSGAGNRTIVVCLPPGRPRPLEAL